MEYVDNTEPPLLYKKWCGISALCAAMERKVYIKWQLGEKIYPNMYIIIVGPSGARKSTAMSPAIRLLKSLDNINVTPESATKEAIVRMMHEKAQNIIDENGESKHSSITIFHPELVVFLGQKTNNWELISWLNQWYDCEDSWSYVTKGAGSDHVNGVWVNLMGATTPEYLVTAFPADAIGGGFSSRIVFVYGDTRHRVVPNPVYTEREQELQQLLEVDLANINVLTGEFEITDGYMEHYTEWYIEQSNKPKFADKNFSGYEARRSLHLRKLTMALSISKSSNMLLTEEDFIEGIEMMNEVEDSMRFVFNGRGRDPLEVVGAAMMKDIIIREGGIRRDELLNRHHSDVTLADFDAIIQKMKERGVLREGIKDEKIYYKCIEEELKKWK
jgi:hypothetical protein